MMDYASVKQALESHARQRNTDPDMTRAIDKWKCPEPNCGKAFPEYDTYYAHRSIHIGESTQFRCSHCNQAFTRKDTRDRHQNKTCLKRPGQDESLPAAKRPKAARGSLPTKILKGMPRNSDGSTDYYGLNAEQIQAMSRLEFDPDVLSSLPMSHEKCDVIYKGELYYRWPGCKIVTKYASTSKLRVHYANSHCYEFPGFISRTLDKRSQQKHIEGFLWLTKAAYMEWRMPERNLIPRRSRGPTVAGETDCETPIISYQVMDRSTPTIKVLFEVLF
ncbi:hypothetical protein PEBR_42686 [Penicillium brasilianum]|uniref:C2H2-type domain-containing protein n=1 Tax=Penicillium brasilianum TaxID=104259 RepID=A0A1S9R8Z8_PENBI|nr:hypothetical protein PEBR_42686 [Penicillium brasilianum]